MSLDLNPDSAIRAVLRDLIDAAPEPAEWPVRDALVDRSLSYRPASRPWLAAAVVIIAVAGLAGVIAITLQRGASTPPAILPEPGVSDTGPVPSHALPPEPIADAGQGSAIVPGPLLLPATTGHEPAVFSTDVTAAESQGVPIEIGPVAVTFLSEADAPDWTADSDADWICFEVTLPGQGASSCIDTVTIATGLGYGAYSGPDGYVHVVGIVPDDVTHITIDEQTIEPVQNVWHYGAPVGTPLGFTVSSATSQVVLGAEQ